MQKKDNRGLSYSHGIQDSNSKIMIGSYSYEEYQQLVQSFHGHIAPGMMIGGFMVDLALKNLPKGELFDALCETRSCLPDAIQILTPCTIGNGWLKVRNAGRYALTLYEKFGGEGIRVFVDAPKLEKWPEIKSWFFKLKEKKDQDKERLMAQIREAGSDFCTMEPVQIESGFIKVRPRRGFTICPLCHEAYPVDDGGICRACQGELPYVSPSESPVSEEHSRRLLKAVPVEAAVGKHTLHDMTQIIPGKAKGPVFKKDQVLSVGDLCRLQQMGRENIYVAEENSEDSNWIHEDEAAFEFARAMAGDGVTFTESPNEGKAELSSTREGLLVIDDRHLEMFNLVPGVMCASRRGFKVVRQDTVVAGTRAIPLYLPRGDYEKAMSILGEGPLFEVLPLRQARIGILVTGTEVFRGLVDDKFIPIIRNKVEKYKCEVVDATIVPDDRSAIEKGVKRLLEKGADLVVTTAGLSVDPDDVTRLGLIDAGVHDILYGTPILPGAMTLLARIGTVQVIGVPACALYYQTTSFDLLLPRLLAGLTVTRRDLARLGHGGLCQSCKTCVYPKCAFGS